MAVTATPVYAQAVASVSYTCTTSYAAAFTAGANGAKIDAVFVSNTSTIADLSVSIDGTNPIAIISIPANAGNNNAIPSVDILRNAMLPGLSFDAYGNKCLYLAPSQVLYLKGTANHIAFIQAKNL